VLARVATFNSLPADVDREAVALLQKTAKGAPGFVAGYHLGAKQGKALSIVIVEDADAARAVAQALAARAPDEHVGIDPDTVEFFEAEAF
jgi:hypothetical protein